MKPNTQPQLSLYVLNKASSSLQGRICNYINDKSGHSSIDFKRYNKKNIFYSNNIQNNNLIIVLRHPLNTMISEYYSYGWTHTTKFLNTNQLKYILSIKNQTIDEYVLARSDHISDIFLKAYENANAIIKYENIMSSPAQYIELLLNRIDQKKLFKNVYSQFKNEFVFQHEDLSEKIINEGLITHKRNLDNEEYKHKLFASTLDNLSTEMKEIIHYYDNLNDILA